MAGEVCTRLIPGTGGSAPPEYNGASQGQHDSLDPVLRSCGAKPLNSDIPGI